MDADRQGQGPAPNPASDLLPELRAVLMRELGPLLESGEREVRITLSKGKIRRIDLRLGPLRPAEAVALRALDGALEP